MKKQVSILLLIIPLYFFNSCSDENNLISNDDFYIEMKVNGEIFDVLNNGAGITIETFCGNESQDVNLNLYYLHDTENYGFSFDMSNLRFQSYFTKEHNSVISSSEKFNIYDNIEECYDNFEILVGLRVPENGSSLYLNFKDSPNNFSKIESITKIKETDFYIDYAVKGSFEAVFSKPNGEEIILSGKYLVPIDVSK